MIRWFTGTDLIKDYPAFKHPDFGLFCTLASSYSHSTRYIGLRGVYPGLVEPFEWVCTSDEGCIPEKQLTLTEACFKVQLHDACEWLYGIQPQLPM